MTFTSAKTEIPNYTAGTWDVDAVHSDVSFSVRHMMVSKVRGRFGTFSGEITTGQDVLDSKVSATVDLSSIDTNNAQRDDHIRSADFFDVEHHPQMTFTSTGVRRSGDGYLLEGDLSLHGVTRPVTFSLEVNGFGPDPFGGTRSGFSASTEINRRDFGIDISMPLDGGGVVLSDTIKISLEIEAILRPAA